MNKTGIWVIITALAIVITLGITFAFQTPTQVEAATASTGIFMNIEGIQGEATEENHRDWIELESISHGIHNHFGGEVQSGSAVERSTGPVNHHDFTVVKPLDKASPLIYKQCCDGTHLSEVKIQLCRATGDKLCYMEYKFTDVIITSVSTSGSSSDVIPTESVTFNYRIVEWKYTQTDHKTGKPIGNVESQWDMNSPTGS